MPQQQLLQQSQVLDTFVKDKELYVKYWILTAPRISVKRDGSTWGVSRQSIDHNIKTAIGAPLIWYPIGYGYLDHPQYHNQHEYQVGKIVDVMPLKTASTTDDIDYAGIVHITNPDLRDIIIKDFSKIPPFVSPAILPASNIPQDTNSYTYWKFAHLAIVNEPAFGNQARLLGTCSGSESVCKAQLKTATTTAAITGDLVYHNGVGYVTATATSKPKLDIPNMIKELFSTIASSSHNMRTASTDTITMSEVPVIKSSDNTQQQQQQTQPQPESKSKDPVTEILNMLKERQEADDKALEAKKLQEAPNTDTNKVEQQPEQPKQPEIVDYKAKSEKLEADNANLQKQIDSTRKEFTAQLKEQTELITQLTTDKNKNQLRLLVPRELFLKDNNQVDEKAYNNEIQKWLDAGYPNKMYNDSMLVEIYSAKLMHLDNQRKAKEAKLQTASATSFGGFPVPTYFDNTGSNTQPQIRNYNRQDIQNLFKIYGS